MFYERIINGFFTYQTYYALTFFRFGPFEAWFFFFLRSLFAGLFIPLIIKEHKFERERASFQPKDY
jgi:hypothetical protein